MKIAVHGLGYVGLTAAVHFARAGATVVGYDPTPGITEAVNDGKPKHGEFLAYLESSWPKENLSATGNFDETLDADAHIVAVPSEKDGEPYDKIVFGVLDSLWESAKENVVVIVESTLAPGTIDRWRGSRVGSHQNRSIGVNWFLAVCPRRDWFSDRSKNLGTLPRVVGGYTGACTQRAIEVLSLVSPDITRTDYRTAEITKALENAFLHVPVMLAHELAVAMPDHNIAKAVELAGTHWRLPQLYLGFGTGGRCVSLGTKYLIEGAAESSGGHISIAARAIEFEENMRKAVAAAVVRRFDDKSIKALVLGIAYRPEFRDAGLSPGLGVAKQLDRHENVEVFVHDPMWSDDELALLSGMNVGSLADLGKYDAVLLATPHEAYAELPHDDGWREHQLVVDGQGAWAQHRKLFAQRGVCYVRVGEPGWLPEGGDTTCA